MTAGQYLLQKPLVQLEGIVSDRSMVEHIRREDDLAEVFKQYHVDYLIVTLHRARLEKRGDCYFVTQPHAEWSGTRVAKTRGEICSEPIVYLPTRAPTHSWSEFSSLDTYVFDVRNVSPVAKR